MIASTPYGWLTTQGATLNFNSLEFLVLFLPATLLAFYAAPMRLRLWVIAGASLFFYGVSGLEVLAALLIAIAWSFCAAFLLEKWSKASAIVLAISLPLFILIMFKYLNFILNTVQAGPETRDHFWFFLRSPAGRHQFLHVRARLLQHRRRRPQDRS